MHLPYLALQNTPYSLFRTSGEFMTQKLSTDSFAVHVFYFISLPLSRSLITGESSGKFITVRLVHLSFSTSFPLDSFFMTRMQCECEFECKSHQFYFCSIAHLSFHSNEDIDLCIFYSTKWAFIYLCSYIQKDERKMFQFWILWKIVFGTVEYHKEIWCLDFVFSRCLFNVFQTILCYKLCSQAHFRCLNLVWENEKKRSQEYFIATFFICIFLEIVILLYLDDAPKKNGDAE